MSRQYLSYMIEDTSPDELGSVPFGHHLVDGYAIVAGGRGGKGAVVFEPTPPATDEQHAALIALEGVEAYRPASNDA